MNLDPLKQDTDWGSAANITNGNMQRISLSLDRLSLSKEKNKGYFITEEALITANPNPKNGDNASAGDPYPGIIYVCETDGVWINTGKPSVLPTIVQDNYVVDGGRADSLYIPSDNVGGGGANF